MPFFDFVVWWFVCGVTFRLLFSQKKFVDFLAFGWFFEFLTKKRV